MTPGPRTEKKRRRGFFPLPGEGALDFTDTILCAGSSASRSEGKRLAKSGRQVSGPRRYSTEPSGQRREARLVAFAGGRRDLLVGRPPQKRATWRGRTGAVGRFELSIEPWAGLKQGWCHSCPSSRDGPVSPSPFPSGTGHALPGSRPEAGQAGQEFEMTRLAFTFLALGVIAAVLGFTGFAGAATAMAKF